MVDNQLIEEISKKLFFVQNKLKNSLIINTFKTYLESDSFTNEKFISIINYYLENKNKLDFFNNTELNELYEELNKFIKYTENESRIISNKFALLDSINFIIYYFEKLNEKVPNKGKVINQPKISEDEFSKRYDRLTTLLNDSSENSNLILHTKLGNQPFQLFRNSNNSITAVIGSGNENKISLTLERLLNTVYRGEEYKNHKSYADVVIEKILDNTIFNNIKVINNKNESRKISFIQSKLDDLDKKDFEALGQISELKKLFEKREAEFTQVSEILAKSKILESEFENAKEAVLKNIELKQATTYWEKQAEKYDTKYKFYFKTNIGIAVCLIAITFYLINFTGLFITNIPDSVDKKITETISQVAHSASFFNYIIFIMFTTIMIWMMKILVKIMLSNYHLSVDANERVIMINTYLVLLEDGKGFEESDRKVILDNIFRQTNHGIIKDETNVTIVDIASSFKK